MAKKRLIYQKIILLIKLRQYIMEKQSSSSSLLNETRVIFLGNGNVGKTALIKRILADEFSAGDKKNTKRIDIHPYSFKKGKHRISAHFWDFGGQEVMRATHQFFLSRRSLYVLVLSKQTENTLEYWLQLIRAFGGNSPILVVLNKIDEAPEFDLSNKDQLKKKYQNIQGFWRISCQTKENLEVFSSLLHESILQADLINKSWPSSWFDIKKDLTEKQEPLMEVEEYRKICEQQGVINLEEQLWLSTDLEDLGHLFHFDGIPLLDRIFFVDPSWLLERIYQIFWWKELIENNGFFDTKWLPQLFPSTEFQDKIRKGFLDILVKFGICHKVSGEEYLFPDLLPVEEKKLPIPEESLTLQFSYGFLPDSLFPQLLGKLYKYLKEKSCWRTGMMLEKKGQKAQALIDEDKENNSIIISIWGEHRTGFLENIWKVFEELHKNFENLHKSSGKLQVEEKLPLPGYKKRFVSLDILWNHLEDKIPEYYDGELRKRFPILSILKEVYSPKEFQELCLQRGIWNGQESEENFLDSEKKTPLPFALKQIFVNGYRGLQTYQESIPVDAPWIFLTGENGFGKTSLLQAIALGLFGPWENKPEDIKEGEGNQQFVGSGVEIGIEVRQKEGSPLLNRLHEPNQQSFTHFAAYGTSRLLILNKEIPPKKKLRNPNSSLFRDDSYLLNLPSQLVKWKLNPTFSGRVEKIEEALKKLIPSLSRFEIDVDQDEVFFVEKDQEGKELPLLRFEELGAGLKSIIAMIGDIIIRLFNNEPLEMNDLKELAGIVLIDELEVHLHPKWVRNFPKILSLVFPKVQFIASTHSELPFLSAPKNSIFFKVERNSEEGIQVNRVSIDVENLLPNTLLTSPLFDLEELFPDTNTSLEKLRTETTYAETKINDRIRKDLDDPEAKKAQDLIQSIFGLSKEEVEGEEK